MGTDVFKLHDWLRKAESLLVIRLKMGTNGWTFFTSRPESPLLIPPSAAMAEDSKW
jgi:hypothetical protein